MAGPNIGYAAVSVIPSAKGFGAALSGQIAGPVGQVGSQAGQQMGGKMSAALGSALKVGLGGALVAGGVVAGLAKLGGSFDEAFDTIRVGTGATGEALEGLQGTFKNVFGSVPTDMGSAATAVADLNTRLGLTGGNLEATATQMLELTRLAGGDLSTNIQNVSRVFGDWGITVDDQGERLDQLFRASQATGITVDSLSGQMVKFGAPLRQLGFDFETTAGLLGKFEKEGVNAELVMGSMRIALGKMARDGEPAEETLQRVTEEIANAGSASEANAMALELFGARAGPDMAAAIREGRFELGDLYDQIADGSETILTAAEDTNDWKESWEVLRNQGFVLLEPIASRVFDMLGTGMDYLAEKAPIVAAWFVEHIWPAVRNVGEAIGTAVTIGFQVLSDWWDANGEAVTGGLKAIGEVIAAAVDAGFSALSNWWDSNGATVTGGIKAIGDTINDPVLPALGAIFETLRDNVLPKLWELADWARTSPTVLGAVAVLITGKVVLAFSAWATAAWAAAAGTAAATAAAAVALLPFVLVGAAVGTMAALFYKAYQNAGNFSEDLAEIVDWLKDLWDWLWKAGRALDNFGDKIKGGAGGVIDTLDRWGRNIDGFIPGFDDGGVMPGPRGVHSLAWVAGGETILPTHKDDFSMPGGRTGATIINNWNGAEVDERSAVAIMAWELGA